MPLDYAYFPHIVDSAIARADHSTLLTLRLISRRVQAQAERQLFRHVLVQPSTFDGRGYKFRSAGGSLPVQPWPDRSEGDKDGREGRARLLRLLGHAEVLDVHKTMARATREAGEEGTERSRGGESGYEDGTLLDVLARIPVRRGEYHRYLVPAPPLSTSIIPTPSTTIAGTLHTYVQEYSVYVGSHWRDRTFYLDYPPGVGRYVVNLRYHINRDLGELYGPAPSCARIVNPALTPSPSGGEELDYVLIFTEVSPDISTPTAATMGMAATQRRTAHTLLFELACAYEGIRRAQPRAKVTLVGVEAFVGSLCGGLNVKEAGRLFESKLRLARMDLEMGGEVYNGEPGPVVYLSHPEYEALVGGREYELETGAVELY